MNRRGLGPLTAAALLAVLLLAPVASAASDATPPTAEVAIDDTSLIIGDRATVTITFSEMVTGLDLGDLSAVNGDLSGLVPSADGVTWTAVLAPADLVEDDTGAVAVDLTGVADLDGTPGTGSSTSAEFAVDTVRPAATVSVSGPFVTDGQDSGVTTLFTEPVLLFDTDDVDGDNIVVGSLGSTDGGTTWTAAITPKPGVDADDNVAVIDLGGVTDLRGNPGVGTATSNTYVVDSRAPRLRPAMGPGPLRFDLRTASSLRARFRVDEATTYVVRIVTDGVVVRTFGPRLAPRGNFQRRWDGRDDQGRRVSSGRYRIVAVVHDRVGHRAGCWVAALVTR